ncbi:MAG: endonuclease [Desulfotalea sp.]
MKRLLVLITILLATQVQAQNTTIDSFSKAKKNLENKVYYDHRETIYCSAEFTAKKQVIAPTGFKSTKHVKRSKKVEWEHGLAAENFGRSFSEWRNGDPQCVDRKGKDFKGRKCAEKVNMEYRYMQSDMHNLFPAIGSVNAMRSNYNFTMIPGSKSDFGTCDMRIENRKAQPPEGARGRIARTYKYMDATYPKYSMSKQQIKLMDAWDKMYPVSDWECTREKRIKKIQGNGNSFVSDHCGSTTATRIDNVAVPVAPVVAKPTAPVIPVVTKPMVNFDKYHGNSKSHIYHGSSCRYYNCKNCTVIFGSKKEAEDAGYRMCSKG